ncbi:hypothetical protein PRUPE_4G259300 [Prunus persica]|uniref:Uncharacterized protein n=1 Tax=Prunus persica TaxID=3760 RepID=A0A251PUC9_PRUPE|nr:hypothetical protein PRUPE_4G259300 [Prunus persica]
MLVYNYSGSKHITESLKRCGISESLTYVFSAHFNASSEEHYKITSVELGISSLADAIT